MQFSDQIGRSFHLAKTPERIVSLVPSQTELLSYLGLEDKIVGVTKFCVHPEALKKNSTVVGGTKKVDYEKIEALKPDIILCNKEENTEDMVLALEKIAPVHVSEVITFKDALQLIGCYGKIFGKEQEASLLTLQIQKEKEALLKVLPLNKLKVAYLIWRKPWMGAGKNTFINTLLSINNFENVLSEKQGRYPEVNLKDLKKSSADIIFLSSEPYPFKEEHIREIQEELQIPVILVDGEYFSWYGSRLLSSISYFKELQTKLSTLL
ncbi:helical backbone metal receptor [Gillisia sp. M10.2A]|uniref:Helical backbone metal receptor n=1 Tax=Gillisia lutea TaxID=2909668 RepID=A0ABS9EGS3_9FLAO|nr:helical backbone metal receptor [Gillisia lutea]MCF4102056.1 helical backbone metal receptor [Gillisia lutea]